jgi:molybdate transport repressor ModE-like protein
MTNVESLDVGRLRLLREVGVRGSIAGAARSLGLTPSAVSQQLAVLERECGASLVDRSPRGVVLTGTGRMLAARTEQLLDVLAAARADLDRHAGTVGGPVRIAAVASAAATFVSHAVLSLAATAGGIEASVIVAEPNGALELLANGDVDLAVVDEYDYVPLALPEHVVATRLLAESLVAVVPAGWRGPPAPRLVDLASQSWVMPPEDASCGQAVRSACRAAGFEPQVRWISDDMLVLARAVGAGHGVAVLPLLSVAPDIAPVEVRGLRDAGLTRRLTALARSSTLGRPSVATVSVALAEAARAG